MCASLCSGFMCVRAGCHFVCFPVSLSEAASLSLHQTSLFISHRWTVFEGKRLMNDSVTWNTHSSVINKSLQQIFKSRRRRNSVLFSAQDEMMHTDSDDAFTVFMPQQLDLKVDVLSGSLAFICGTVSDQRLIPVVMINLKVLIVTLLQLLILPAVITPDRRPRWQRQWSETDRVGVPFF